MGGLLMETRLVTLRRPSKIHVPSTVLTISRRAILGKTVTLCSNVAIKLFKIIREPAVETQGNMGSAAQDSAHLAVSMVLAGLVIRILAIMVAVISVLDRAISSKTTSLDLE
jgi:hypothetical protein